MTNIDIGQVSETWQEKFDDWEDQLDSGAEWWEAFNEGEATWKDINPVAWSHYWQHFAQFRNRKAGQIRWHDMKMWRPSKPQANMFRLCRHLSKTDQFWIAFPHGERTRNVVIDVDNHDDKITKEIGGLSLAYLVKLKRLYDRLPRQEAWMWAITSKTFGVNLTLNLQAVKSSASVHEKYKARLDRWQMPFEVYPHGDHNHRMPFGADYVVLGDVGPIYDARDQIDYYVSARVAPTWEDIYSALLEAWLAHSRSFPMIELSRRLKILNAWEAEDFPTEDGELADVGCLDMGQAGNKQTSEAWTTYRDRFGHAKGAWFKMIRDLSLNGLPCEDDLASPVIELSKWLLYVEQDSPDEQEATEVLLSWLQERSNGNVTRLNDGDLSSVRHHVKRLVAFTAKSDDFNSYLSVMRGKRLAGKYADAFSLKASLGKPGIGPNELTGEGYSCITCDSDNLIKDDCPIPLPDLDKRLDPFKPKRQDARLRQLEFSWQFLTYLKTKGGEASVSKRTTKVFGYEHNNQSDKAIKVLIDLGLVDRLDTPYMAERRYRLTVDGQDAPRIVQDARREALTPCKLSSIQEARTTRHIAT